MLFNAPMVRALLDGTKTQTRRIMKRQPSEGWTPSSWGEVHEMRDGEFVMSRGAPIVIGHGVCNGEGDEGYVCPYGQYPDRLWVRETFARVPSTAYRGSVGVQQTEDPNVAGMCAIYAAGWERSAPTWSPSIHMPRWASRITLTITDVRVRRLQDISEEDAIAEGIPLNADGYFYPPGHDGSGNAAPKPQSTARSAFAILWDSAYGAGSWECNDLVWVISFKRCAP